MRILAYLVMTLVLPILVLIVPYSEISAADTPVKSGGSKPTPTPSPIPIPTPAPKPTPTPRVSEPTPSEGDTAGALRGRPGPRKEDPKRPPGK